MRRLRLGIPSKGRLAEQATRILQQAGLSYRRSERSLFARAKELPVELTFLRTNDIPVLCGEGAIDLGITGSDLVAESNAVVTTRLRLGIGHCRLALCVAESAPWQSAAEVVSQRIATTFPRVTREFCARHQGDPHLVPLSGSVEIMIELGVADAIVDLVETGSTLAANGLRMLAELGQHETVVIESPHGVDRDMADRLLRRIESIVI
ncbi:MAG TPA: ATP phosphoribosyltransferase, partial [Pirellulaceae bacterium]